MSLKRTDNYFRAGNRYFFFNGLDKAAVEKAWELAKKTPALGSNIAMWDPPYHEGPWDEEAQLVGHRRRRIIELEAQTGRSTPEEALLEINAIESRFTDKRSGLRAV
jgi:hypothetical protein